MKGPENFLLTPDYRGRTAVSLQLLDETLSNPTTGAEFLTEGMKGSVSGDE
jgi:hypothetical protein